MGVCAILAGALLTAPAHAAGRAPAQFVAKMYSEVLGRMPDSGGWTFPLGVFTSKGCTKPVVADVARSFYTSTEFGDLGYDNAEKVLTLYRGVLNREPDQPGLDNAVAALANGITWNQLVEQFVQSTELANLVSAICGTNPSYYYGTGSAATLPVSGSGFAGGTGDQLQALLDAAPAGGTVYLAQKAVVRVNSTVVIPAGKTLATTGLPDPRHYAAQGRLVRSSSFEDAVVRVMPGAKLLNTWVDGQRGAYTNYTLKAQNIQLWGGTGTTVADSKISNSQGWTNLQALGSFEGVPCTSNIITGNLVTGYSSDHFPHDGVGRYTDGLSIACENATVVNNGIIDATDVAIVLFKSTPAPQASTIRDNLILSAGNPAYGGLGMDGGLDRGVTNDFSRASFTGNTLWTGPYTHFDIGIAVGTREWFGTREDNSTGVVVRDNTTGGLGAIVNTGIAVTGMYNATVTGNDLEHMSVQPISSCPRVKLGIDSEGYAAGGQFQAGGTSVRYTNPTTGGGCIGH